MAGGLGSGGGIRGHDGGHARLGGGGGGAGPFHLIPLGGGGEGRGEEQLGPLGHDADVGAGGRQGADAAADAQDHRHLRDDARHLGDGRVQLGAGGQRVQALGQLGAHRVVEGDHRAAGLGGQLQQADHLVHVLRAQGLAVLPDGIDLLVADAAEGGAHRVLFKDRPDGAFAIEPGEDIFLVDL